MTSVMTVQVPGAHGRARTRAVRVTPDLSAICADLDTLGAELQVMWRSALEGGDFEEVTRLVEASHAVYRAVIALSPESVTVSRVSRRPAG